MGQLTGQRILNALSGLFSALDEPDRELVKRLMFRRIAELDAYDNGSAATTFGPSPLWYNDTQINVRVTSGLVFAAVNVIADPVNYASFVVTRLDPDGLNPVVVATYNTDVLVDNDMIANVGKALVVDPDNAVIQPGFILTAEVQKFGAGVPVGTLVATARFALELVPE